MRIATWDKALMEYVEAQRDKPFEWAQHDCVSFMRGAVQAQLGEDIFKGIIPSYKTLKAGKTAYGRMIKKGQNYQTVLNSALVPCELLIPPRGSVVAKQTEDSASAVFGAALGIVVSRFAAFVGQNGLEFLPVGKDDEAWLVE